MIAFLTLYEIGHGVDRDVLPEVVAGDFHDPMIGSSPRPGGRPRVACDDDGLGAQQNVGRPMAFGNVLVEGIGGGDADDQRPGLQTGGLYLFGVGHRRNWPHPGAWWDYIKWSGAFKVGTRLAGE